MYQKIKNRGEGTEVGKGLIQILNQLPLKVLVTSRDGRILYSNRYFKEQMNVVDKDIEDMFVWDLSADPEKGKKTYFERLELLKDNVLNSYQTEVKVNNETNRWLDVKVQYLDFNGFENAILWVANDIDLFKDMEKDLLKNRARSQAIFDTATEGIITFDRKFRITNLNPALEKMFGYSRSDLIAKKIGFLIPDLVDIKRLSNPTERVDEDSEILFIGTPRPFQGKRQDGSMFPLELNMNEVNLPDEKFYTGLIRDISESRELENEIIQIAETERFKIGQELHDGVGQMLSAIGLMTKNLSRKLRSNKLPGADELDEITEMIHEADEEIRYLSHGLAHIELQNEGLEIALKRLCERFKLISKTECKFICCSNLTIDDKMTSLHLFRIVQESVNNAVKHGNASQIIVKLQQEKDKLVLTVKDNGTGLFANLMDNKSKGMGLSTMQYRAELLGGYFELSKTSEGWTEVKCSIPI